MEIAENIVCRAVDDIKPLVIFLDFDGTVSNTDDNRRDDRGTRNMMGVLHDLVSYKKVYVEWNTARTPDAVDDNLPDYLKNLEGAFGCGATYRNIARGTETELSLSSRAVSIENVVRAIRPVVDRYDCLQMYSCIGSMSVYSNGLTERARNAMNSKIATLRDNRVLTRSGVDIKYCGYFRAWVLHQNTCDKGTALEDRIRSYRNAIPMMIGDTNADVPGVAAAERLGGAGILVSGGEAETFQILKCVVEKLHQQGVALRSWVSPGRITFNRFGERNPY